jgi:hypothetical protein
MRSHRKSLVISDYKVLSAYINELLKKKWKRYLNNNKDLKKEQRVLSLLFSTKQIKDEARTESK